MDVLIIPHAKKFSKRIGERYKSSDTFKIKRWKKNGKYIQ